MAVPNLDCDSSIDLMAFWQRHQSGRHYEEIFPQGGKGAKRAAGDLANYASNLHTAQQCRLRGDIAGALVYEKICESICATLPGFARW